MTRFILASESPRRKELLGMFNIPFDCIPSQTDEVFREHEEPDVVVMALALEKALDVASRSPNGSVVLGADTIVYMDGILGKPADEADAWTMLRRIQGKTHEVYTGFALVRAGTDEKTVEYVRTKVTIRAMEDALIQRYIDSGEVWGKAGAYAIQGKGSVIVESIEGDYFNVVGLPISRVFELLSSRFNLDLL